MNDGNFLFRLPVNKRVCYVSSDKSDTRHKLLVFHSVIPSGEILIVATLASEIHLVKTFVSSTRNKKYLKQKDWCDNNSAFI